MDKDDWEKEYEAERARIAAGGGGAQRRRGQATNDDELFSAYYGTSSSASKADQSSKAQAQQQQQQQESPFFSSSSNNNTNNSNSSSSNLNDIQIPKGRREAALQDLFGGGTTTTSTSSSSSSKLYPDDEDQRDCRFDIAYDPIPPHLQPIFQDRSSPFNFFVEPCDFYVKAFIGQSKIAAVCFVTTHGVYIGDTTDGSIVVGMPIRQIGSLYVVGPQGVGFRCTAPAENKYDIFVKFQRRREVLVEILKKLYKKHKADQYGEGGDLFIVEGSEEREKSYRSEVKWLKKGEFVWTIEDDPRSGLDLVPVPPEHRQAYAPLVPKLLHHFGGVNHISYTQGKSKVLAPQRRGCWITPGAIFLSLPAGPGDYGDRIRRCIYAENMRSIILAEPNQIGIVIASGPAQPDLLLEFDSPAIRARAVFALRRIFTCRTHHPLFVRALKPNESAIAILKLADETNFKPAFEPMFAIPQLVQHLQTPAIKKK